MNCMMYTDGELFVMQMHLCLTLWLVKYYSGCELLLNDINHLRYLMFLNSMPTIQKVCVLALIHKE